MRLIGEVYRLPCPHCKFPVQIVLHPDTNNLDPRLLERTAGIPDHEHYTSTFQCPECNYPISILGKLIFVVSDVEEFDEIGQHR